MKVVIKLDHGNQYRYYLVEMNTNLFNYLMNKINNKTFKKDTEIKKTKIINLWKASNFRFG